MSEERFEQGEREDEDVEAHRKDALRDVPATDDPGSDESDDVEAHRKAAN
jgi:hypothetical protein